jgi:hypothetical protein
MSITSRILPALGLVAGILFAPACVLVVDDENTLVIENDSNFFLDRIYIAEDGDDSWGSNLAPSDGLGPDEAMEVELDCGEYDLRVVDEEGLSCLVRDIDLCLGDEDVFVFRNNTCDVFEAALRARQDAAAK